MTTEFTLHFFRFIFGFEDRFPQALSRVIQTVCYSTKRIDSSLGIQILFFSPNPKAGDFCCQVIISPVSPYIAERLSKREVFVKPFTKLQTDKHVSMSK